jgi:parvulin-like peptidyl-prolyl isomerase
MHCCTNWPRLMWVGLLLLSLQPLMGCASGPLDWLRRGMKSSETAVSPSASELATSQGAQTNTGSLDRRPDPVGDQGRAAAPTPPPAYNVPGQFPDQSPAYSETPGESQPPKSLTQEEAYRDWDSPSASRWPAEGESGTMGAQYSEPSHSSDVHLTATGYHGENESADPGPIFPDSVPAIQADDPVFRQRAGVPDSITVEPFEPARILARVGSEVILAGDVLGPVNQALAPFRDKVTEDQMAQQRELLIRQQLRTVVESKLMYLAFLRQIPDNSRAVAIPQIWQQVHKKFDEDELPQAIERANVTTAQELDGKLREYGWSIAKQRRTYGERALGMEGAMQSIDRNPVVTHQEMLDYYEDRADQYAVPASARWEQLSVRFDRTSNRQEAYEQIVRMGNEIVLGGAPFWAVAKRDSHDIQAEEGGVHDWTTQGSLASRVLDRAIFGLPIGQLSEIIEDNRGYHIIRVLERREAGRVPFTEAQVEIKKKIQGEKRQQQFVEYTERLRREIPVWTIYDDEDEEAEGLEGDRY